MKRRRGQKLRQSTRKYIRNAAIAVIRDVKCHHPLSNEVAYGSKLFPIVIMGVLSIVFRLAL